MPRKLDPTLLHAITPPAFDKGKLHRAELVDRIHANLEKSLIVIAAPAGYGKTTLLADFAASADAHVCWVRLGAESPDPSNLARLVAASIRARFRRAKSKEEPRIDSSSSAASSARALSGWIDSVANESFVLIVDDAHHLNSSSEATAFVDELLRLRPSGLTLILSGREVPDLSLARLLAEGELAGLGPHDLALTREETRELATAITGRSLDWDAVDRLHAETGGWITGVILSGNVVGGALRPIAHGGSPLVYEYLSSVVLNRLPDDLRRFALDASVLPVMTPDLCDAVLQRGDSARLLRQLVRKGVFIDSSEGSPPTYSFQELFRSFLEKTLASSDPGRQARLRARAAVSLERSGGVSGAFELFADAGEVRRASDLAERHAASMLEQGRLDILERWWKTLVDSGTRIPHLLLAVGNGYMDKGSLDKAEGICRDASVHIGPESDATLRARLENLVAAIQYHRGDYEGCVARATVVERNFARLIPSDVLSIALQNKALALATMKKDLSAARRAAGKAGDLVAESKDAHALPKALSVLGYVLDAQGQHRELSRVVERVVSLLDGVGSAGELASAYNNLADAQHKAGQLDSALVAYGEGLRHARQAANPVREATVYFGQADIFSDVGMALQAAQLYGEGLALASKLDNPRLLLYGCVRTSALYRRRNNLSVAKEWMKRALEVEARGSRVPSTTIQMAALEERASPANAIVTLKGVASGGVKPASAEDMALAGAFLARGLLRINEDAAAHEALGRASRAAVSVGAEQVLAAEIACDMILRKLLGELVGDGLGEAGFVQARVDAIDAFRALREPSAALPTTAKDLRVTAFGPGQIQFVGKTLGGMRRQAREVLFYLIDRKAASREVLAEQFWPHFPEGRRSANIHSAIHAIRRMIGKDSLLLEDGVYSIGEDLEVVYDVAQFERSADIAERLPVGDPRRFFGLTEAVSTYKGPFLPDLASEWVSQRRHELELRYLDLVAELASEALIRDQPKSAIEHLRHALAVDPLRDDFNIRYMEALGRLGQIRELSSHYNRYTRLLREELGIDPPASARDLYSRLIG